MILTPVSQDTSAFFWEHRNTERRASKVFLSEQLQETPENCLIAVLIRQPELQEKAEFKNYSVPSFTKVDKVASVEIDLNS